MQAQQHQVNRTFLIIILGILAALGPFTIDMYLPGFQRIAEDFNTDEKHVAFTLTSYFFGISIGQLIYGPVVDKYGRKKPLLVGLLIYTLAALGCAFAVNIEMMIGMRLLQALGGCVGMVASNAIISDVYEKDKMAKAFSSIMLVMGVAPLIAPSFGSLLLEKADWNYIFIFLAVLAVAISLMIYFFLPETNRYTHTRKLKIKKITRDYWTILQHKTFLIYTFAGSLAMSVLFAYISSSSFIFQTIYGLDKATFSIIFALNAMGLIAGSYLNGFLTRRVHFIKIAKIASVVLSIISILSVVAIWGAQGLLSYKILIGFIFTILFLLGFINPNATAASLSPFKQNAGAASALGGALRMGVGAVVAAIIGVFQGASPITMFATTLFLAISACILLWSAPRWEADIQRKAELDK